jgi:hypothetical protein
MTPVRLKRMLLASARRLPGLSRRQVGAGFVNNDTTSGYLAGLTAAEFLRVAEPEMVRLHPRLVAGLDQVLLSVPAELPYFLDVANQSQIHSGFDIAPYGDTLAARASRLTVSG